MRKFVSRLLLLSMLLYLCLPLAGYVYAKENISISINDTVLSDAYSETIDGRLYVAARDVAAPMGLNLDWNDYNKTLKINGHGKMLTLIAAANFAIADNMAIDMQEPLKIISDRSIVDIGLLCDVLDAEFAFSEQENTYNITVDIPDSFVPDVVKSKGTVMSLKTTENFDNYKKVREIAEILDLSVEWDDTNKCVIFTSENGDALRATANKNHAWFNGNQIDCVVPLKVVDSIAYFNLDFVTDIFSVRIPDGYTPCREIAAELNLSVTWDDENKTLKFTDKNGNELDMILGNVLYTLNNKYFNNSAPLLIKNDTAMTNSDVVADAFSNNVTLTKAASYSLSAAATDKTFRGQIELVQKFSYSTSIIISVASVRSYVYSGSGSFTDVSSTTVNIPANTDTVKFSLDKTNCDSTDSYVVSYSLPTNNYYYSTAYMSSSSSMVVLNNLTNYSYYVRQFGYYEAASDLVISPVLLPNATLENKVFSGSIKTPSTHTFGSGAYVNISVRSVSYTENILASTTVYPTNNSQSCNFSVSVPNTSGNRNASLYLRYDISGGNKDIAPYGYYVNDSQSTVTLSSAYRWSLAENTSNINFVAGAKTPKTVSGTIRLPSGMKVSNADGLYFDISASSVRTAAYQQPFVITGTTTYQKAAKINYNQNSASYSVAMNLNTDETYIFGYTVSSFYSGIQPAGYAAASGYTTDVPSNAERYTYFSDTSSVNFNIPLISGYSFINNLPFDTSGYLAHSDKKTESNGSFVGYYLYLTAGQTITIDLKSSDFDAYLYLLGQDFSALRTDDDSAGGMDSRIVYYIANSGCYYIQASSYSGSATGAFRLTVNTDKKMSGNATFENASGTPVNSIGSNTQIQARYLIQNKGYAESCGLYMALYDKSGKLLKIQNKNITANGYTTTNDSLTMNISGYNNIGSIKCFAWSSAMDPFINPEVLDNSEESYTPPTNSTIILQAGNTVMTVQGSNIYLDVPPIMVNGRILVPLRSIAEAFEAEVEWHGDTQSIYMTRNGSTISMQLGSYNANVNGTNISLDVPPQIIDGRTMVPVRFIAEFWGTDVSWIEATQTLYITI